MAVTEVFNTENKKVGEVELNEALFGLEVKKHILHDVVKMQLANRRSGAACTKTRTEVRGGGKKPYRQKGTGRARAGTNRSPLWRGGGVVFGPKPRDYSYKLPKKVRKLGVRMALSSRFSENNMLVLEGFDLSAIKTKQFVEVMKKLNIENGLIVIPERNENLEKSSRNVKGYKVIQADGLNVYDILLHRHLVLLQSCLGQLEKRLLT
jgi:large subunit ribosomal protein L4